MNKLNLILAIGGALVATGLLYFIFGPTKKPQPFYISSEANIDPRMSKVMNFIGGDLLSLIPEKHKKKSINSKAVDDVFRGSGNPWNVTKTEFFLIRVILGVAGTIIALLISITMLEASPLMTALITAAFGVVLYFHPYNKYKNIMLDREAEFKRNLPEAIDYLSMALSGGGYTLSSAFEVVLNYLPQGVVREEFEHVVTSINAGQPVEVALNGLADRVPTPSIQAFVKALNSANSLNVPMDKLLKARSEASRKDLMAEIERKITNLPTRLTMILLPAAIISILIIAIAPMAWTFIQSKEGGMF